MKTLPSAIDAAKKLIEDYPYLFTKDEHYKGILETAIAMAILQYSLDCDKALNEPEEPNNNVPEVFTDIFKQFKFQ